MPNAITPVPALPGIEIEREETRTNLAYISLGGYIFLLVLILAIGLGLSKTLVDDTLKILSAVASILGGIVGAIVGFYFRGETK